MDLRIRCCLRSHEEIATDHGAQLINSKWHHGLKAQFFGRHGKWKEWENVPIPFKSRRGRRGDGRFLRGALGVGGAFLGGEPVGVAAVFVLDGGVEAGKLG